MQSHKGLNDTNKVARIHRVSWRNALGSLFGAAHRLHRYRDIHTRMVRGALCAVECTNREDRCQDE